MRYFLAVSLICLICCTPLTAEILSVTAQWDAKGCKEQCAAQLEKALKNISGAADIHIDPNAGQAVMRWKPRSRFYIQDFNIALRNANIKPSAFFITVRGTLTHTGKKVTLDSLGDNTSFELLSPLQSQPKSKQPLNPDQFSLEPGTYQHLVDSEQGFYVVTVSGVLLMPERAPPNRLIIQSIQGGAPEQASQQQNSPVPQNTSDSLRARLLQKRESRLNQQQPASGQPNDGSSLPQGQNAY